LTDWLLQHKASVISDVKNAQFPMLVSKKIFQQYLPIISTIQEQIGCD